MAIGDLIKLDLHPTIKREGTSYKLISDFLERPVSELAESEHFILYDIERRALDEGDEASQGYRHLRQRQTRAYHKAKAEPVMAVHLNTMLSQNLNFSQEAKARLEFLIDEDTGDATGEDEPFSEWAEFVLRWRIAHGFVATIVDGPPKDDTLTEAERREARQQPHFASYRADEIITWERFVGGPLNGKYKSFVVTTEPKIGVSGEPIQRRIRFYVPDEGGMFVRQVMEKAGGDKQWQVTAEDPGNLPYIPVVVFGKDISKSWLLRTVELEKASFNLGSAKSNTIYQQCFRVNFVAGASVDEIKAINESTIVRLKSADAKVFSLDEGNPEAAIQEEDQVSRAALDCGMMRHNRVVDSDQVESADSKEKDLTVRNRAYNKLANQFERYVNKLLYYAAIIDGADESLAEQMTFSIPRDFGLVSFEHEALRISQLLSAARETQNNELYRAVVKTLIAQMHFAADEGQNAEEIRETLFESVDRAELASLGFNFDASVVDDE